MVKLENIPSHNMEGKYVTLVESSFEFNQSWYVFIKMEGNEKVLYQLSSLINQIDWEDITDVYVNIFSLEVDNLVSAQTAKEMTMLSLNHVYKHRKFDGKLRKIPLEFNKFDSKYTKMSKINDLLKNIKISMYIDDEDVLTDYDIDDDSSFVPESDDSGSSSGSYTTEEDDSSFTSDDDDESISDDGSSTEEECSTTSEDTPPKKKSVVETADERRKRLLNKFKQTLD
jgi:hypothetical protein